MREREGKRGAARSRGKIGVFCRDDLCVSFCERRGRRNGEREDGEEAKARKPEFRLLHSKVWVWVD